MEKLADQNSPVNYEAFIADLRAKRDAIDQAIKSFERLVAFGAMNLINSNTVPGLPDGATGVATDGSIRSDTFFNLTIVDAVKKYLGMSKQPKSLKEILAALEAGGFVHDSVNFYATVHSSLLRREKVIKDVVRVKRKWALTAWYPNKRQSDSSKD